MAENILVEIAEDVMINKYGLDETEYKMFKFSEGTKAVTIGMTNGEIPVTASFPIEVMQVEIMKRWTDEKKELYLRDLLAQGEELNPELLDSFHLAMLKIEMSKEETAEPLEIKESEVTEVDETPKKKLKLKK